MKKIFGVFLLAAVVMAGATSCKSKQKVVNISGAEIEAAEKKTEPKTTQVVKAETIITPANEVTRGERFDMAEGEVKNDAFYRKFHVVVGSFGVRDNAKNLQSTLNSEGNNALVVVNEQGMYRVLIASYDDYTAARTRITQISTRFPDAWVLRQK